MTVHHARVIALAAVLVGMSALVPSTRLHAQQPLDELPLDELRVLAEQGDAAAQLNLGVRYATGQGVPQNDTQAARWFLLAADQEHAAAQGRIGFMYSTGRGVPQDDVEAARWYRRAADQGHANAQSNLGAMYADGKGVSKDSAAAVRWFRLAADQGHATAQYNLGVMYATGQGVLQDDVEAHMWLNLAVAQSSGADRERFVQGRGLVSERLTPEQFAEAQRRAREWTPTPEP